MAVAAVKLLNSGAPWPRGSRDDHLRIQRYQGRHRIAGGYGITLFAAFDYITPIAAALETVGSGLPPEAGLIVIGALVVEADVADQGCHVADLIKGYR